MKKRKNGGFTFAETLITVALIGIIFLAVSGGLVAFQRAYTKITRKANAQVMLSTAILEITDDLKNATIYYAVDNAFYTTSRGYAIQYEVVDGQKNLGLQAVPYKDATGKLISIPLLTTKANTDDLVVTCDPPEYDKTTKCFTITVYVGPNDTVGTYLKKQTIIVRPNNEIQQG